MKKYTALILALFMFVSCSSAAPEIETEPAIESETLAETETEPETEKKEPVIVEVFNYYHLEAAGEPKFEDGILVVYFTEDDIRYTDESEFYIGVRSEGIAYSVKAASQVALYPDMITNEAKHYHSGVALLPEETIPAGEYLMSVTFEDFICEFNITVE